MKTSELQGAALDWAVAIAQGLICDDTPRGLPNQPYTYKPSTDWAFGGPIIEREKIGTLWEAQNIWSASTKWDDPAKVFYGKTKLIAAMRCYVASKMGEEVQDGL